MPTLEALQRRQHTLGELAGIVRTMKTLSAVSIRQCERAASALADYDADVASGLAAVLAELPAPATEASADPRRAALVLLGSDHGLCGHFNEGLLEAVHAAGCRPSHLLAVGERLADLCADAGLHPLERLPAPVAASGLTTTVAAVLGVLAGWREQQTGVQVRLWHPRIQLGDPHQPQALTLLPPALTELRARRWPHAARTPGLGQPAADLLAALLEEHLFVRLYRALAEALASEHQSRLLTMEAAEHHIAERLAGLDGEVRQARQEAITGELLDLVAGFEAMAR